MEGTPTLEDLIRPNNYTVAYNLKEAYNNVPVHPSMRDLLGITYKGTCYTYCGMPSSLYKDNETLYNGDKRNMENKMCCLFR
jgi:hypothetical protein